MKTKYECPNCQSDNNEEVGEITDLIVLGLGVLTNPTKVHVCNVCGVIFKPMTKCNCDKKAVAEYLVKKNNAAGWYGEFIVR